MRFNDDRYIFKEPNVGDGGAYKCTASNRFGESNANINLNFAGSNSFINSNIDHWNCRNIEI